MRRATLHGGTRRDTAELPTSCRRQGPPRGVAVVVPLVGGYRLLAPALASSDVWILLVAAAADAGAYLTYYAAGHLVGAGRAMSLNATYPVWAVVFGVAIISLHPSWQLLAGVLVTLSGTVLVVGRRRAPDPKISARPW